MKSPEQHRPTFAETIEFNKPMNPQEAIEKLATFHNVPAENIVSEFMNLRDFTKGTVVFEESVANGYKIIYMRGNRPDGQFAWGHRIDWHTGQPVAFTG